MFAGFFLRHHFNYDIFSGCKTFLRSEFQPAAADTGGGALDQVLFLADFAGHLALHVAENALAIFNLGADDAKTVEGGNRLLRLLGLLGRFGSVA